MDQCLAKTREQIEEDFGDVLILVCGRGKVVNGSTHLRYVLGKQLQDFLAENRRALGLSDEDWHLYMEDVAPCHCGDKSGPTNETGLKDKRNMSFTLAKVVRHCFPRNGTPELCINDQLHKLMLGCLLKRGKWVHWQEQVASHNGKHFKR